MFSSSKLTVVILLTLCLGKLHAAIEISLHIIEVPVDVHVTANSDLTALSKIDDVNINYLPKVSVEPGRSAVIIPSPEYCIPQQACIPSCEVDLGVDLTQDGLSFNGRYVKTEHEYPQTNTVIFYSRINPLIGTAQDNVPILFDVSNKHYPSKRSYLRLKLKEK